MREKRWSILNGNKKEMIKEIGYIQREGGTQ